MSPRTQVYSEVQQSDRQFDPCSDEGDEDVDVNDSISQVGADEEEQEEKASTVLTLSNRTSALRRNLESRQERQPTPKKVRADAPKCAAGSSKTCSSDPLSKARTVLQDGEELSTQENLWKR